MLYEVITSTIEKAMDRDNYMTAEAAKAFGLVDEVVAERPTPAEDKPAS